MEIKEKKVMTELIFSKEEGDFIIKLYDIISTLSYESDTFLDDVFENLINEIEDQKKKGREKYRIDVEDYYD